MNFWSTCHEAICFFQYNHLCKAFISQSLLLLAHPFVCYMELRKSAISEPQDPSVECMTNRGIGSECWLFWLPDLLKRWLKSWYNQTKTFRSRLLVQGYLSFQKKSWYRLIGYRVQHVSIASMYEPAFCIPSATRSYVFPWCPQVEFWRVHWSSCGYIDEKQH